MTESFRSLGIITSCRNGMLGEGYSSKLSPWLALGCISPRRIWSEVPRCLPVNSKMLISCLCRPSATRRRGASRTSRHTGFWDANQPSHSLTWHDSVLRLIFELTWRDFFIYMALSQGTWAWTLTVPLHFRHPKPGTSQSSRHFQAMVLSNHTCRSTTL